MMTCTSEMSGNASSGICRSDQIPVDTSRNVPVKTRKRFFAQQSIQREITSHSSRSVDAELLAGDGLSIFLRKDSDAATFRHYQVGRHPHTCRCLCPKEPPAYASQPYPLLA